MQQPEISIHPLIGRLLFTVNYKPIPYYISRSHGFPWLPPIYSLLFLYILPTDLFHLLPLLFHVPHKFELCSCAVEIVGWVVDFEVGVS